MHSGCHAAPHGCADYICLSLSPDCGAPGMPANGAVELYAKKQRAKFSCDPGYQLEGNSTWVCQRNREWSGQLPLCTRELEEKAVWWE